MLQHAKPRYDYLAPLIERITRTSDWPTETKVLCLAPPTSVVPTAAALMAVPALLRNTEAEDLSRRRFLRNVAIGAAAGVTVLVTTEQARAGFWGFVGAAVFGSAISWVVTKVFDWAWNRYSVGQNDLTPVATPTPTNSAFHNSFAPPHTVSNPQRHIPVQQTAFGPFGVDDFLLRCDLNYPEMNQERAEGEALIPYGPRIPVQEVSRAAVRRAAERYRFRQGDYDPHYLVGLTDRLGQQHLGVGALIGGREQFMII